MKEDKEWLGRLNDKLGSMEFNPPEQVLAKLEREFTVPKESASSSSFKTKIFVAGALLLLGVATYFWWPSTTLQPSEPTGSIDSQSSHNHNLPQSIIVDTTSNVSNLPPTESNASTEPSHYPKNLRLAPAYAGNDTVICGTSYQLMAAKQNKKANAYWKTDNAGVSFLSKTEDLPHHDPNAIIQVENPGEVVLYWVEEMGENVVSDPIRIEFRLLTAEPLADERQVCGMELKLPIDFAQGQLWVSSPLSLDTLTTGELSVKSQMPGDFYLYRTLEDGTCLLKDSMQLKFLELPLAQLLLPQAPKCSYDKVLIQASYHAENYYSWSFGRLETSQFNEYSYEVQWLERAQKPTVHLEVTSPNGCKSVDSLQIDFPESIEASFEMALEQESAPTMAYFTNRTTLGGREVSLDSFEYHWEFGDGEGSHLEHPDHLYKNPGTYAVQLVAKNHENCVDTFQLEELSLITENTLAIAKFFTPNGDNKNDVFDFQADHIDQFIAIILNASGEKVYQWSKGEPGWDGTLPGGSPAAEGSYYYVIRGIDQFGNAFETPGLVYLIRN